MIQTRDRMSSGAFPAWGIAIAMAVIVAVYITRHWVLLGTPARALFEVFFR